MEKKLEKILLKSKILMIYSESTDDFRQIYRWKLSECN